MDDIKFSDFNYISSVLTKTCPNCFKMFTQKGSLNRHLQKSCKPLNRGNGSGNYEHKRKADALITSDSSSNESDSMSVISNSIISK